MARLQLALPDSFFILVKTKAPKTELIAFEPSQNAYRMNVQAIPEQGKANIEIIKYFKKELKQDIVIVSGFTSRKKLIRKA